MGTLKTFLDSKKITAEQLVRISDRIEAIDASGKTLLVKRAAFRRSKEATGIKDFTKKYSTVNIEKPKAAGRGLNTISISNALADRPVARKIRAKMLRAVNHLLTTKKDTAVEMKALFEGTAMKLGKKAKEETKKK